MEHYVLEEKRMATGEIYTTEDGDVHVRFAGAGFHGGERTPTVHPAWREKADGSREQVFWNGAWLTDVEMNGARVRARTF